MFIRLHFGHVYYAVLKVGLYSCAPGKLMKLRSRQVDKAVLQLHL